MSAFGDKADINGAPTRCLLLAQNGHSDHAQRCPLLGVKRPSRFQSVMSAFDPNQTWQHLRSILEIRTHHRGQRKQGDRLINS
jgi:hypothetical protein